MDNVGQPVTATDADKDAPTYALSGADKRPCSGSGPNGQIEVAADAKLDYETKKVAHSVTVTANDGYGGSNSAASISGDHLRHRLGRSSG